MVSPQETGAFQPQPSLEKGKKLGGLRGKFAKATLFAGGLTAAAAGAVNAGGNAMLITGEGGTTGEFCDNGDYVLVTDFDYAAKLTEQLASGELIIAFGPAPVAALKEGDKTAAVQPTTITPDEIWANLAKPAPECPVVVDPTPEPTPGEEAPDSIKTLLQNKVDPKAKATTVISSIDNMYKNDKYKTHLKKLTPVPGSDYRVGKKDLMKFLNQCINEKQVSSKQILCAGNIENFIIYAQQYPINSGDSIDSEINSIFVNAAKTVRSVAINEGISAKKLDAMILSDAAVLEIR